MPFPIGHNRGPVWRAAIEARRALLLSVEIGKTLTYQEMSDRLGCEIASAQDSALQVALRRLQKEGIAFENVLGVGYARLDSDGAVTRAVRGHARKAHRAGKRGLGLSRAIGDSEVAPSVRVTKWGLEAALSTVTTKTHGNSLRAQKPPQPESLVERERKRLASGA